MSSEMVREKVIRVFSEFKKIPPEEITDATTFEQLGFDSLDGLNLIFELEEQFDLVIPDDKAQSMKSGSWAILSKLGPLPWTCLNVSPPYLTFVVSVAIPTVMCA